VETFGCDKCLFAEFVALGITEDNSGEGGTAAGVVNDFFYDSTNVAISFGEIKRTESSRVLVQVGM